LTVARAEEIAAEALKLDSVEAIKKFVEKQLQDNP